MILSNRTSLAEKVVIVTGAASGIGAAIVKTFQMEGSFVVAVDQSPITENIDSIYPLTLDITQPQAIENIILSTKKRFGRINILINNAGIGDGNTNKKNNLEKFDQIIATNLRSAYQLSDLAMEDLIVSQGSIVNISSVFAVAGFRGTPGYSVSKGGLSAITRQLAADYSPKGVRINAIAPGLINTPLTRTYIENNPRFYASMIGCTAMGRVGQPEDVANTARFLCSDEASFITGQVINVDGGWTDVRHFPSCNDLQKINS